MSGIEKKAVAHIVKMIKGESGEQWIGFNAMFEGFCGWNGPMSPLNRPAFVSKFGKAMTDELEKKAKEVIESHRLFWERSAGKQHEIEASTYEGIGDPGFITVGSFVWGVMDGMKCDHGNLRRCIRHLVETKEGSDELKPRICKVVRIEQVEDIERDIDSVLDGWQTDKNEGGFASDDVTDEECGESCRNYRNLTTEQKRTFYTLAVLVRDTKKRYFLIDPEGFDYPRYAILPKKWETMFSKTVGEIKDAIKTEKEAAAKAKAEAEAKARAAYLARCEKWEGMMEELPANLKGHIYLPAARKIGKRNVLAMAKSAFPWVRFTVSYDGGWGRGYYLNWKNGPSVDEVKEACDFGLFKPSWDTFDGMTDCSGTQNAAFTDFSDKFGGVCNGVSFNREECEKDFNGDPNGKVSKPSRPSRSKAAAKPVESCEVTENTEKDGIEIRFPNMPSEEVRNFLKSNGYRWSKFSKCWYCKATAESREVAAKVVEMVGKGKDLAAA